MTITGMWVIGGPGLPCGARPLGPTALGPAPEGRTWLDVCLVGQHLPQMYARYEIRGLSAAGCERLGLFPDCLGNGDLRPPLAPDGLIAARGIDQVTSPCPNCGGSGRPAVRVAVTRGLSGVTGSLRLLPHAYTPAPDAGGDITPGPFQLAAGTCLACGMPEDGTDQRAWAVHR